MGTCLMGPGSLLQISRALVQGMSPNNSSLPLHWPKAARHQQLERFRKRHVGGTGAKDLVHSFIAKSSASAYQFLLADTTTCKISSLQWPPKVWSSLLYQQPKGWQAAKGTFFMQAALVICQPTCSLWKPAFLSLPDTLTHAPSPKASGEGGWVEIYWNLPLFVIYS